MNSDYNYNIHDDTHEVKYFKFIYKNHLIEN